MVSEPVLLVEELIGPGGTLTLASVDLTIPLTALYRTTALLPPAP